MDKVITSVKGKIPTHDEYMKIYNNSIKNNYNNIFTYLNFDKLDEYN